MKTAALYLASYTAYAVLSMFLLWIAYLAVMRLATTKDAQGLNQPSTILGTVVLIIGYLLDFNANIGVMTMVGLELPRETTVTARLKRWITEPEGSWHRRVAEWLEQILDPFDPSGDHV